MKSLQYFYILGIRSAIGRLYFIVYCDEFFPENITAIARAIIIKERLQGKQTHAGLFTAHGRAGPVEPTFQRHLDPTGENA